MARKRLEDKVVVITGASSGIGRATALACARQGASVVLAARRGEALVELVQECEAAGGEAHAQPTDVRHEEEMAALRRTALAHYGRIDVWVNNAAVTLFSRFEEAPPEEVRQVVETNLMGTMHGCREALHVFREQGGKGLLINVSSMVGKAAIPYVAPYCATKFAIIGLSESLRQEVVDTGIEVSTILPASIDTPLFQHGANHMGRAAKPMEPIYPPEDVAEAIVDCILKPKREVVVGPAGRAMIAFSSVPGIYERAMPKAVEREHFQDEPEQANAGNLFEPMPHTTTAEGGWRSAQQAEQNGGSGRGPVVAAAVGTAAVAGAGLFLWWALKERPEVDEFRPDTLGNDLAPNYVAPPEVGP